MNPETLERRLIRYGTDPRHWPWLERLRLKIAWQQNPEIRTQWEEALRLEAALRQRLAVQPPIPASLSERLASITSTFPSPAAPRDRQRRDRWIVGLGGGWAVACGVAGLVVGASGLLMPADDSQAWVDIALGQTVGDSIWPGDAP